MSAQNQHLNGHRRSKFTTEASSHRPFPEFRPDTHTPRKEAKRLAGRLTKKIEQLRKAVRAKSGKDGGGASPGAGTSEAADARDKGSRGKDGNDKTSDTEVSYIYRSTIMRHGAMNSRFSLRYCCYTRPKVRHNTLNSGISPCRTARPSRSVIQFLVLLLSHISNVWYGNLLMFQGGGADLDAPNVCI